MIPRLPRAPAPEVVYAAFLEALRASGFEGDLSSDDADRTVLATDNSVYEIVPQAVAFPRGTEDLARIARAGGGRLPATPGTLLATGFSCRCQAERLDGARLPHPASALLAALRATTTEETT
ncbi:hypothetical protein [Falsiroseomonas sp. HW251]|uniref:hypothetical protein n=1 Tax=Falsiroseomonas sp. HW251 TaxID=3390998 RepID=UPI003D31BCFB